jgi:hypothetical protein
MTTSTTHQSPRSSLSGAPSHVPDSPILVSQSIQISPEISPELRARDMSDLCYALRCVHAQDMPDSTIAVLAELLLQSVDKDCINLTVGPHYEDLMEALQNTLQLMNFHCWAVLSERHNRLNGTPGETLIRSLTLPECTSTSMREQPETFQHLFVMLSLVGVRRLNLHTDDGVHDLRDVCMLRGLEEISVLAPVAPQRWLLLVGRATSVEILGSELPAAIRVHCDASHDILRLAKMAEATANLAEGSSPPQAAVPEQVDEAVHEPPDEAVHVHLMLDQQPGAAGNEPVRSAIAGKPAAMLEEEPRKAVQLRLKKKRVPRDEQRPKPPLPVPGLQLQHLPPQRSAAHSSSMVLMALFGTAMLAGGLRQSLGCTPPFEPAMAGPTTLPSDLTPQIDDEFADEFADASMAADTLIGTSGMSFLQDQCPALGDHAPDLLAALAASRHLLRASPSAQFVAVDTRPAEAVVAAYPQPIADLLAGKGFDGKPGLLLALKSGGTADVAEYMKRLAALDLEPSLNAVILASAADEYHALAHAMLNQHITSVAAFMGGLKALRLTTQQIADILAATGSRGYSGLHVALVEEKSAAVVEFMDRLKGLRLDRQQTADVALARNINGYPGLFYAMERGSSLSVPVFMAGLKALDLLPEQIVDNLKAKDGAGNFGLYIALMSGHASVVTAFMQGLRGLQGLGLSASQIVDIIKCENADGVGGLYMALQYGQTGVVRALMEGVKGLGLGPELVAEVLVARNPAGSTGLSVAIELGHAQTVRAFMGRLKGLGLSPQQIADITQRRNPEAVA